VSGDQHLSVEQVEFLLGIRSADVANQDYAELSEQIQMHLSNCEECQRLLALEREGQGVLNSFAWDAFAEPGEPCPQSQKLYELAGGLLSAMDTETIMKHVTECDYCGPRLRQAVADLSPGQSSAEDEFVASLKTGNPNWQARFGKVLTQMMAKTTPSVMAESSEVSKWKSNTVPSRWRWYLPVAAGLIICSIVATWIYWGARAKDPDQLLARSYVVQRTMEMRISGAPYAPVHVIRGLNSSAPAELHEAMAIVLRQLSLKPQDAKLLDTQGKAVLLQGNYDEAILTLEHARRIDPASEAILIDLASAYFQAAENGGTEKDYGKSIDLLGEVLSKDPNNVVALFNRAVVNGRIPSNEDQAISDWEHYLEIDSKSDWRAEALQRLADTKQKLEEKKKSSHETGRDYVGAAGTEQELGPATTQWLPQFYEIGDTSNSSGERSTDIANLRALSRRLFEEHDDRWMLEMLEYPPSSDLAKASKRLSLAIQANLLGDASTAKTESRQARDAFLRGHNTAGFVRADLEEIYALQRSLRPVECLSAARRVGPQIVGRGYAWIEIQLLLEEVACNNMTAQLSAEEPLLSRALAQSHSHSYGLLYMRALGFAGSLETAKGNWDKSWDLDIDGLRICDAQNCPGLRRYQFFSDLAQAAEERREWYLAIGLWRQATVVLATEDNKALRAQAYYELASLESMIGNDLEAKQGFIKSNDLFFELPLTDSRKSYLLNGEISLASLEARSGNFETAVSRLQRVQPQLSLVSDYEIPLHFYQTLGGLYARSGHLEEAERALKTAVNISEWGLGSLKADADRYAWELQRGEAYRSLIEIEIHLRDDLSRGLEIWEWFRGASQRYGNNERAHLDLARLDSNPNLLAPSVARDFSKSLVDRTLIVFAHLPSGYGAWTSDDRGIDFTWLPIDTTHLESLSHTFSEECADVTSNEALLKQHGAQLYQWIFKPLASHLQPQRTLILETDDAVAAIPFRALVDESGNYLLNRFEITESIGIMFDQQLRPSAQLTGLERALVVGSPKLKAEAASLFPRLSDAQKEASQIAQRFRNPVLLIDEQATADRVLKEIAVADIFHYAGHAFSSSKGAGLVLATTTGSSQIDSGSAVLYARDLRSNVLKRCRLAVLSACSTINAKTIEIIDPDQLVHAFMVAGVPNVVASRWDVDSRSAAFFMDQFYMKLFSGASVPVAIQFAGRQLLSKKEMSHPFYWAAFSNFGVS
jgi:CHAT domain-containing protein/cytochrome c-type biogenesis protein CcmH/NrfG